MLGGDHPYSTDMMKMKKNIRKRIEENAIIFFIGAMIVSFGSGFGAYKVILDLSKLDTVQQNSYVLKEDFSNFFVEWDQAKRQYVLRHTDNFVLEATSGDNIIQLEKIGSKIRNLTYHQYKLLRSQALDKLIRKQVPNYVSDVLENTQDELSNAAESKYMNPLLLSITNEILSQYFNEREKVLGAINSKERAALDKHKLVAAQWTPPSYANIANLNLKERQIELVKTQVDISRIRVRDFIEIEWTPVFLQKVSYHKQFLHDLNNAMGVKERLDIFNDLFDAVFIQVNEKYESLDSIITKQQYDLLSTIDSAFIELISGKVGVSEFDSVIDTQLNEKVRDLNMFIEDNKLN